MIYLNNAATSYPKPKCVIDTMIDCLSAPPLGQSRGSRNGENDLLNDCRNNLARFLGIAQWENIYFSSGATESSNSVIRGIDWREVQIYATETEHNSILRPLYNHPDKLTIKLLPCDQYGYVDEDSIANIDPNKPAALFINHCSNVTGAVQDIEKIALLAKERNMLLIVDASQSAGCIPIEVDKWGIDILILTGHKSLMAVQGTGAHYVRKGIDFRPYKFGGTGFDSSIIQYTGDGDYEYEPGTQNLPGIAALNTAIKYLQGVGVNQIFSKEKQMINYLINGLRKLEKVKIYSDFQREQGPLLSMNIKGLKAPDLAYILSEGYDIVIRAGLHCAPLIHKRMGTGDGGTLRVSLSQYTSYEELNVFLQAIVDVCKSLEEAG